MRALLEIGTNYCQKATLGWKDDADNFFLHCHHEDNVPVVSARVFSAEGTLLFELLDNQLTRRSLPTYRRIGFHNGWRIIDEDNREVLSIITEDRDTPLGPGRVTRIDGNMYDKDGKQVCRAGDNGLIVYGCPMSIG